MARIDVDESSTPKLVRYYINFVLLPGPEGSISPRWAVMDYTLLYLQVDNVDKPHAEPAYDPASEQFSVPDVGSMSGVRLPVYMC